MNLSKNGWQVKSLGELIDSLESGGRPKGGGLSVGDIPSLGAEHLNDDGRFKLNSMKFIPNGYFNTMNNGILRFNDILIVKDGATTGKTSIVKDDFPFSKAAINEHLFIVRTNKEVLDPKFAFYYLYSPIGKLQIMNDFRGSAQGGISREFVNKVSIPLPPLPIQKQIAEILEKADKAKQKRQDANKLTDEFLQSVFVEMFGDPVKNPNSFSLKTLEEICQKITDGTHHSPKNNENSVYKYITPKNIKKNGIDLRNITYINKADHKAIYSRCNPEFEDILYIKDGVTTGIAQVNTLKEEFSMLSSLALFKLNKSMINPYYLRDYLNNGNVYQNIRNSMGGAAITRLTLDKLKRIKVVVPPISLQQQFAELVNKTETLKEKQKQSEQELENLFQSLMQKAFKGELVS